MKSAPPHTPHAKGHEGIAASDQGKPRRAMSAQAEQQPGNRQAADEQVDGQHDGGSGLGASAGCAFSPRNFSIAERMSVAVLSRRSTCLPLTILLMVADDTPEAEASRHCRIPVSSKNWVSSVAIFFMPVILRHRNNFGNGIVLAYFTQTQNNGM